MCLIPFLWVCYFAGRDKQMEIVGWVVQVSLTVMILNG